MPPDTDEKVHGNQYNFPEHVEKEKIPGGEDSNQTKFQQQQESEEFLFAILNVIPGKHNGDGSQECRQDDEPETQTIDAHMIVNLGRSNPDRVGDELLPRGAGLVTHYKLERSSKGDQRERERQPAGYLRLTAGYEQREQEAERGNGDDKIERAHRVIPPLTPSTISNNTEPTRTQVA